MYDEHLNVKMYDACLNVKMYDACLNIWHMSRWMIHAKLTNLCMSQFMDKYYVWCKVTW